MLILRLARLGKSAYTAGRGDTMPLSY